MKRPIERELVTCAEAAEILGISLQAVYQGLRNGIISHELVLGRKMIDPDRLVQRWRGVSDQEAWAARCNGFWTWSARARRRGRGISGSL